MTLHIYAEKVKRHESCGELSKKHTAVVVPFVRKFVEKFVMSSLVDL